MTPITTYGFASSRIVWPRIEVSPANRLFHSPQLNTTVPFADGWSSWVVNTRPRAGRTSRVVNKLAEHSEPRTFSGSWPPVSERLYSARKEKIAKSDKFMSCFFHSLNTPGAEALSLNLSSKYS